MIKLSFLNLFRRKSRTFLSLLGVIIGVAVIILLVSIVDGTSNDFTDVVSQFQGLMIMEKDAMDQTLSKMDEDYANKIEKISNIRVVVKEIWFLPAKINGEAISGMGGGGFSYTTVYGMDTSAYSKMRGSGWLGEIDEGKMIESNDDGYVTVGNVLADKMDLFIGSSIKINGERFKVKGIMKSESDMLGEMIVMNIDEARDLSDFPEGKITSLFVELEDPSKDKKTSEQVNFRYGEEIEAWTPSNFSDLLGELMGSFRLVVWFIAAISAIVAGVGIINTILMSVMERRKEIGALLATGWTKNDIITIILLESFFIGVIGGVIGLIVGIISANYVSTNFGLTTYITLELLLQAFMFAVIIGIIAGIYPAKRASELDPVEALRS